MKRYELEKTDVLIIGAGAAGARAAIACADNGVKTILVTKGPFGISGITVVGFDGYGGNFDQPGDTPEFHLEEIVKSGKYLCDQDIAQVMANEAQDSIKYCDQIGVRFSKDDSKFHPYPTPGCKVPRMLKLFGGGYALLVALKKKVEEYGAHPANLDVKEDTIISKLLVKNNQIYGAIGLDIKKGIIRVFHSKAVILAAGGAGYLWPHSDCPPDSVGDAYSLAFHAGVKLVNMEQQLFYPTIALFPQPVKGLEVSYEWCLNIENPNVGGWLVNGKDEIIYPLKEVGTRDYMTHLMTKEVKEGRGSPHQGIYLDITRCSESRKKEIVGILHSHKRLLKFGVDIRKQKLEVAPAAHTTLGGARIDAENRTNVNGLFACGEATGNVHGANRLAGHSYLDTQVFGARAGKFGSQFAKGTDWISADEAQIDDECNNILSYLESKQGGISPSKVKSKIVQLVGECLSPIRNKNGIEEGIKAINFIRKNDLPLISAPNFREFNNDWAEAIEVRHMLDCAEMISMCALAREESRGTHYREDFPYMDNENTVKHTVIQLKGGKREVTTEPVNMIRFKPRKEKGPAF